MFPARQLCLGEGGSLLSKNKAGDFTWFVYIRIQELYEEYLLPLKRKVQSRFPCQAAGAAHDGFLQ